MSSNAAREMLPATVPAEEEILPGTQLQKLSERHKLVAALVAQGIPRQTIAAAAQYTPEYVTMLQRQPLFIAYVREMNQAAAVQLEAMFSQSVQVIAETMSNGGTRALDAARMQLEATGRLGRERQQREGGDPTADRLTTLAERLVGLLETQQRRSHEKVVAEV